MSYFSALARQSGVQLGSRGPVGAVAPRKSLALDVEATRVASAATAPMPEAPPSRLVPSPPAPQIPAGTDSHRPSVDVGHAHAPDRPAGAKVPPPPIREVVVEVEQEVSHHQISTADEPAADDATPDRIPTVTVSPREPAPPPALAKPAAPAPSSKARKPPTLEDVRSWVAQPSIDAPQERSFERRPEPVRPLTIDAPQSVPELAATQAIENFTLEIGAIQITLDAPPSAPARESVQVRPTTAAEQPFAERASRHYIRC